MKLLPYFYLHYLLRCAWLLGGFVLFGGTVTAQCLPAAGCQPGSAPAANLPFGMGIYQVTLAGLDTTTNGAADGYQDYGCGARAVRLVRGASYTLAVRTNTNADERVRAWLDYNRDGLFTADELILSSTGRQHTATFAVPFTAPADVALRLRIAADYVNAPVPMACSTPQYSQTEDYRVVVMTTAPPRPQARFSAVDTVSCGQPVRFQDQSLHAPAQWRWDFGDGQQSVQQHPHHTYAHPGAYTVRLSACNAAGCDSVTRTGYIMVRADAPRPAACQPTTAAYCCSFGLTRVQLAGIDQRSADGTAGFEDFSCPQRATLTADRPYTLQLTTGPNGHDVRVWLDLNDDAQLAGPAELLYEGLGVQNPLVSLTVPATAAGLVYGRPLRLRIWADAAGSTYSGVCTPPQRGQVEDYSVVLQANTAAPAAAFALQYQQLCGPVSVSFTNQTTGGATLYHWDFGDGTTSNLTIPPTHTYQNPGVYEVRMVATNAMGRDTTRQTVAVAGACPTYCPAEGRGGSANYAAYFTRVQLGALDHTVPRSPGVGYRDFTAHYTELRQGNTYPVRLESPPWTFAGAGPWARVLGWIDYNQNGVFEPAERLGDHVRLSPVTFTLQVPLHAKPGATRLRLQISNANEWWSTGESCPPEWINVSTEDYTVVILPAAAAPRSGFTVDMTPSCTGIVQLRDTSWVTPTQWHWNFGDGQTSAQQHPQHTYAQSGTYTVTLQAANRYGSSSNRRTVMISNVSGAAPRPAACVPPGGTTRFGRGIGTLQVGSFTYAGRPDDAGYRDETCAQGPLNLITGGQNAVRVTDLSTSGVPYANHVFIWLDGNDNGRFDFPDELVFSSLNQHPAFAKTGSINIPATAVRNRPLRLRVVWDGYAPTYVPAPCYRDGASQVRDFTAFVQSPTPTKAHTAAAWQLYPNPSADGRVVLHTTSPPSQATAVEVRDALGRCLRRVVIRLGTDGTAALDLSGLPAGVYFLHHPSTSRFMRFIIE